MILRYFASKMPSGPIGSVIDPKAPFKVVMLSAPEPSRTRGYELRSAFLTDVEELRFDQLTQTKWQPYSGPGATYYRTRDGLYMVRAQDGYVCSPGYTPTSAPTLPPGVTPGHWAVKLPQGVQVDSTSFNSRRVSFAAPMSVGEAVEKYPPLCNHKPVDNGFRRAYCKCGLHAFEMKLGRWEHA